MERIQEKEHYQIREILADTIVFCREWQKEEKEVLRNKLIREFSPESFGNCLKKYIYRRTNIEVDYSYLSEQIFLDIMKKSVFETRIAELSSGNENLDMLLLKYLRADVVTRDEVFWLGFALKMPVQDVSFFLMEVLKEEDFDFLNPFEVIQWYCLFFGKSHQTAKRLMERYDHLEDPLIFPAKSWREICTRPDFAEKREEYLFSYLNTLKRQQRFRQVEYSRQETFKTVYDRLCKVAFLSTPEEFTEFFYRKREEQERDVFLPDLKRFYLSAERIRNICSGNVHVDRYDILTLLFFLCTEKKGEDFSDSCLGRFCKESEQVLSSLYMSPVNIKNTYENLLLQCFFYKDERKHFQKLFIDQTGR